VECRTAGAVLEEHPVTSKTFLYRYRKRAGTL